MVLCELGMNIAPILASAGIIGLALGFGAQNLVKDFLSGVFMMFEDQYGVGDVVDLGEASGTVEAVSLRVTRLRDVDGTVWYVRNGEILRVGNMSQNWARTVLDINVGYDEDLVRVRRVLQEVAHGLWEDEDYKRHDHRGARGLGREAHRPPTAVTVRVTLKTAPMEQWRVAREMRERIKARFDHEGIEIHNPQRLLWHPSGDAGTGCPGRPRRSDGHRHNGDVTHVLRRHRRLETMRRIVARVLRGVAEDEVLRPLYPEEDLGPAEERILLFLVQYWGGPTTYSEQRGHPRLRMRHAPFAVTPEAKDHWLRHFRGGARRGRADRRSRTRSSGTTSPTRRSSWSTPWSDRPAASRAPRAAARAASGGGVEQPLGLAVEEDHHDPGPGEHGVAVADLGLDRHRALARRGTSTTSTSYGSGAEQDRHR